MENASAQTKKPETSAPPDCDSKELVFSLYMIMPVKSIAGLCTKKMKIAKKKSAKILKFSA